MTSPLAKKAFGTFLESGSLYSWSTLAVEMESGILLPDRIDVACRDCDETDRAAGRVPPQTRKFVSSGADSELLPEWVGGMAVGTARKLKPKRAGVRTGHICYTCSACGLDQEYWVAINFGPPTTIQKVGQFPPLDISVPSAVLALSRDAEQLFRKGITAEAHGFGIGSFAYFRRLVEGTVLKLIEEIRETLSDEEREKHSELLDEIMRETKATRRLELAAKLLPSRLIVGGSNPLAVLFAALSDGLHEGGETLSDAECLDRAARVRTALTFLVRTLSEQKRAAQYYAAEVAALLKKQAEKKQSKA